MTASVSDWADRLKGKPLPAMSLTVQIAPQLVRRTNTTNTDYQRVLVRDPGFALAIFRSFDRQLHPPREPVNTLAHAIALLGILPITEAAQQLPVLKKASFREFGQGLYGCYSRAGHAACYARQWALLRKDHNPEEMAIAALLHNCGEMALWAHSPDQMRQIEHRRGQGLSRQDAALAVLGFTLDQLSFALAAAWRLPPLTGEALQPDGAFKPRSLGVMLAAAMAESSGHAWDSQQTRDLTELLADYIRTTTDHASALLHTWSAVAARDLYGLPIAATAGDLLLLHPSSPKAALEKTTTPSIPQERDQDDTADLAVKKPTAQAPTSGQEQRLHGGFSRLMKELRDDLGLERAMFAMLTPDRKTLRARFVAGADPKSSLHRFQLNTGQRTLFSLLMAKPQGLWLNKNTRDRYLPLIPPSLMDSVNSEGFFSSSLFFKDKPLGILYADHSDAGALNPEGFVRFKQLALRLGEELGPRK